MIDIIRVHYLNEGSGRQLEVVKNQLDVSRSFTADLQLNFAAVIARVERREEGRLNGAVIADIPREQVLVR